MAEPLELEKIFFILKRVLMPLTVNKQKQIFCSIHQASPPIKLKTAGLMAPALLCEKCMEEMLPFDAARKSTHPVVETPKVKAYMCAQEGEDFPCGGEVDYHNECMLCRQHFCDKHMTGDYICTNCHKEYKDG